MAERESILRSDLAWGILEGSVGPRVRLLRNALSAHSIAVSAHFGLPTGSLTVLALISANPGSSQSALARRAGLNKSALVGIVDRLEKSGLVVRDRLAGDRRRYKINLTAKGKQTMQALFDVLARQEDAIHEALGEQDMAALLALLDRAIAALGDGKRN